MRARNHGHVVECGPDESGIALETTIGDPRAVAAMALSGFEDARRLGAPAQSGAAAPHPKGITKDFFDSLKQMPLSIRI
jgi:hypothetical protein